MITPSRYFLKIELLLSAMIVFTSIGRSQLATNAPKDKRIEPITKEQINAYHRAIAPYVAKAKATYPEAKKRYLAGLPPKHIFFITTVLHDKNGNGESAFIQVEKIKEETITGAIVTELGVVKEFKPGQKYSFPEKDLIDWTISKPDGTEEGNVVGKFLDTYKP